MTRWVIGAVIRVSGVGLSLTQGEVIHLIAPLTSPKRLLLVQNPFNLPPLVAISHALACQTGTAGMLPKWGLPVRWDRVGGGQTLASDWSPCTCGASSHHIRLVARAADFRWPPDGADKTFPSGNEAGMTLPPRMHLQSVTLSPVDSLPSAQFRI